jgi:hypothetical protein
MSQTIASRPEARFALIAGIAGALAAAAISVKAIIGSASSTAGIGFVFVPFIMAAAMVFTGVWGLALGCVWYSLRGTVSHYRAILLLAWIMALGLPAYAGWQIWQGLALERAVAEVLAMNTSELEAAMRTSPWRENRFFIGAVAQNKAASETLLDQLALLPEVLPEAELYEPLGSLWDVKGDNPKGLAAMRLVVLNPNVGAATLARLADGPHADKVIGDIMRNAKLPERVLARYYESTDPNIEWGMALNPRLPVAVMERIAKSGNLYACFNLTYNPATPRPILEALTQHSDATLQRHAQQALDRLDRKNAAP